MDRRDFFKKARKKYSTANAGRSRSRLFAGLTPYNGNWTVNEVAHLLKRTMFGARKTDIDYFYSIVYLYRLIFLEENENCMEKVEDDGGKNHINYWKMKLIGKSISILNFIQFYQC